ncbi:glycosyltransferase [Sphingomonas sp. Tas61C01]|uniref:glycosyltransferase n=1 Tax=Sphingomonas sp. Tas61C01 TaxID=3458297 RepID=UPI00403ED94E
MSIIAIGRNEGDRLKACLRSLPADATKIYVDSGSTDDSVAFARSAGVEVMTLPPNTPFTAALARNTGLARVDAGNDSFVQMIDGDCSLDAGWLEQALAAMRAEPDLAVVFGRRRERFPERSIYNRMCDDEWDVPVGEARSCGGDALFRTRAIRGANGYDPTLIAGEEPDLCLRMRGAGWRLRRIDAEMTLHDAAMTRFGQWWRRTERGGHAFAELAWRHGSNADPHWRRETRSIVAWGIALPVAILLLGVAIGWWAVIGLAIYPLQMARIAWRKHRAGDVPGFAAAAGFFLVIGKFAQAKGLLRFHLRRLTGGTASLIEYKGAEASGG